MEGEGGGGSTRRAPCTEGVAGVKDERATVFIGCILIVGGGVSGWGEGRAVRGGGRKPRGIGEKRGRESREGRIGSSTMGDHQKYIYLYIYPHGLIIAHKKARMADTTMFTSPPAAPSPSSTPRT